MVSLSDGKIEADDCGDDLSSIDVDENLLCMPCGCDTEEELSEEEHDMRLLCDLAVKALARGETWSYPVDWDNIKQAQPGGDGRDKADPHAPKASESPCPPCRNCRRRNDLGSHQSNWIMQVSVS